MDFGSTREARVEVRSRREALRLTDDAEDNCSIAYRAPELFDIPSSATLTEQTDIWSLGCLLFAMAYGEDFRLSSASKRGRKAKQ